MTITVVTSAAHNRLTTLEAVKRELNINSTDTEDDKLIWDFIQQASDMIERFTGQKFAKTRVNEKLPSFGGVKLMVTRTPVKEIHFIEFDGSSVSSTEYTLDNSSAGLIFKESGWTNTIITTNFITRRSIHEGRRDWEVEYTAGYTMPGDPTSTENRDLPHDLEKACIETVKTWFFEREKDPFIWEEETGDAREEKFRNPIMQSIPPSAVQIIQQYQRIF